jgi:hypothetical protein
MEYNLNEINGVEIIDFLNKVDVENENEFGDTNLSRPLIFTKQEISDGRLKIYFDCYYNNWGTDQLIEDNHIVIYKDKIRVALEEPLEGDGTDEILEELISDWIVNHTFKSKIEKDNEFHTLINEIHNLTGGFEHTLDDVKKIIEKAEKARTLIE